MLLLLGIATSITTDFFCRLSINMMSGWCVCLDLGVQQDLSLDIFYHLRRCIPFWPMNLRLILTADVPVHYAGRLVMAFHVCCSCPHLSLCYYMLKFLRSVFAQPPPGVLFGIIDPCLYWSFPYSCAAMISASVLSISSAFSSHWLISAWYLFMVHALQPEEFT